jgi:signal transduction histidine kinase
MFWLFLMVLCTGILVTIVILDKRITDKNLALSESEMTFVRELNNSNYDLTIIGIGERAYVLDENSDSVLRYNLSVAHIADRLHALNQLAHALPDAKPGLQHFAWGIARHILELEPAIKAAHHDKARGLRIYAETVVGENSIAELILSANMLRDQVLLQRAALIDQMAHYQHYSLIVLIIVLISAVISFLGLALSIRNWLRERSVAIHRLYEAKMAAEDASRAKTNFLALMSHELRTPLNAILGFSEMIRDRVVLPGKGDLSPQYAADIHSSGTHLLNLINNILQVAQNEAGKTQLSLEPVDVQALAKACLKLMQPQAAAAGVQLNFHTPPLVPIIMADEVRLTEIMLNLLSNAVKFTLEGGTVSLSLKVDGDELSITVQDTGVGIAAKDFSKLFEPFGQVANPVPRRSRGTGLGLPIAKHLVELHRGTLKLTSREGVGTIAEVRLPVPPEAHRPLADFAEIEKRP